MTMSATPLSGSSFFLLFLSCQLRCQKALSECNGTSRMQPHQNIKTINVYPNLHIVASGVGVETTTNLWQWTKY